MLSQIKYADMHKKKCYRKDGVKETGRGHLCRSYESDKGV